MSEETQSEEIELLLVAKVEDFPPNSRKVIKTRYEPVLVVNVDSEILAVSNICPHSGSFLDRGAIAEYIIECPRHFWPFDLRTGCLVGMPDFYDDKLATYKVRQVNGELYLEVPPTVPF